MFDTIAGLPVHVLVIHVVVVLGPLAALAALAYVVRPVWRARLRWPVGLLAVVTGLSAAVAAASGEDLEERVAAAAPGSTALHLMHEHVEAGDLARTLCLVFMVVALLMLWVLPAQGRPRGGRLTSLAASALVTVLALGMTAQIIVTGHTGAKASWEPTVAASD